MTNTIHRGLRLLPALLIASILSVLAFAGCSAMAGGSPCVHRTGSCFDMRLSGHPVVPLDSRDSLQLYESDSSHPARRNIVQQVSWRIEQPLDGPLRIEASPNELGKSWFGESTTVDVAITPLTAQQVKVKRQLGAAPSVRVGGTPVAVVRDVLAEDRLPPGDYVFEARLRGPSNWDKKSIFVTVR